MKKAILAVGLLVAAVLLLAGCLVEDVDDVSITYDSRTEQICVRVPRSYGIGDNTLQVESLQVWTLVSGSLNDEGREEGCKLFFPRPEAEVFKIYVYVYFVNAQQCSWVYEVEFVDGDLVYTEGG